MNRNIYDDLGKKPKKKKQAESPTAGMRYDVCSMDGDVIHSVEDFKQIKSFSSYTGSLGGGLNRNHVIKYIVLMYSEDTILNQRPPLALNERKLRAAELAGFERSESGKYKKSVVDQLFNIEAEQILNMIFDYLKKQNNHVWTEICTTEQELDEYTRLRFKAVSDDKDKDTLMAAEKKDKLRESCKRMIKDLKEYYREFFADHDDVKEKVKSEKKYYTMESLARGA